MKTAVTVNVPQAKTEVPAPSAKHFRVDTWRGRIRIAPDFDAPLTDAELAEWGS